jgi:hypothetical protein
MIVTVSQASVNPFYLVYRHAYTRPIAKRSLIYKRMTYKLTHLCLIMLMLALFVTSDEDIDIFIYLLTLTLSEW